jgi:serine/threonine protein phosphatase PrpC
MGNCCASSNRPINDNRTFHRRVYINVKTLNIDEKLKLRLKQPEAIDRRIISTDFIDFTISCCVIPGQDPREEIQKNCQDNFLYSTNGQSLLAGIFDGHGKNGREIVKFCVDYMHNYFQIHEFKNSPKEFLTNMIEACDKSVINESEINCSTSGTTAAILYIDENSLWSCSVGDSRALLGTLPKTSKRFNNINDTVSRYKRPVIPDKFLKSVQLTLDQKPNISYELERIIKQGGIVQQASNTNGEKIGPYRIWKGDTKLPGLAMSRSIGDRLAKTIGVISSPILHSLDLNYIRDQFLVIATDGVWDVMDNVEVINFIEKYRRRSVTLTRRKKNKVYADNSVIAEYLCEEARYRWLDICSKEDVSIDDISAIIIELKFKGERNKPINNRKGITIEKTLEVALKSNQDIIIEGRFDMERGSNAVIPEVCESKEVDSILIPS